MVKPLEAAICTMSFLLANLAKDAVLEIAAMCATADITGHGVASAATPRRAATARTAAVAATAATRLVLVTATMAPVGYS